MANSDEILLAALLHDVGKFAQRARRADERVPSDVEPMRQHLCPFHPETGHFSHAHALWTRVFFDKVRIRWPHGVDGQTVARLASAHHKPSSVEEAIIQRADGLAAGLDRPSLAAESERAYFRRVPLYSIFESLAENAGVERNFAHDLKPLEADLQGAFPVPVAEIIGTGASDLTPRYATLWREFIQEVADINAPTVAGFTAAISSALLRFTWCIPASTQHLPDVSLYDHMKTTAAVAVCLHRALVASDQLNERALADSTARRYLFLAGDFSGIQRYLFDVTELGVGGTAKRLRARSFQLGLFAEVAAMRFLRAFDLTPVNLLLCSGGRFTALLPNLPDAEERINILHADIQRWLHGRLQAQVRLSVAQLQASAGDFASGNFSGLVRRLEERMQEAKQRPFDNVLQGEGGWREAGFVPGESPGDVTYRPCEFCGKLPADGEEEGRRICSMCRQDSILGGRLPHAAGVAVFENAGTGDFKSLGASFSLLHGHKQPPENASWALAFNGRLGVQPGCRVAVWPRFLANVIPRQKEEGCATCPAADRCNESDYRPPPESPLTFSCIARLGRGRHALGFLKGDVDHLGRKIAFGFPRGLRSISRLASLSRMLDLFFCGHVNRLLEKEFAETYTVYSGGDDFLQIGPWDRMLDLAQRLREDFGRFTCGRLTLSAGYSLVRGRTPVAAAAPMVERALREAKDGRAIGEREGRNQARVFGTTLKWERMPHALEDARRVSAWLDAGVIPVSAIRRLLVYAQMWRDFKETGDTAQLRFVPLLSYDLARNWPGGPRADVEGRAAAEWASRFRNIEEPAFAHLRMALEYALNTQRKE